MQPLLVVAVGTLAATRAGVEVEGCPPELASEVRRLVALELGATTAPADVRASVTCGGESARVVVGRAGAGGELARQIALSGVPPEDRARLLALSIAELATAVEAAPPSAEPAPPAPAVEATAATPPPPRTRPWLLSGRASLRTFGDAPLLGGGVAAARRLSRRLDVEGDVLVESARRTVDLGELDGLAGSLGATVGAATGGARLTVRGGLGGRVGLASLHGQAATTAPAPGSTVRAGSVGGAWGGPLAAVSVGAALAPVVVQVGAEAGYAIAGLRGLVASAPRLSLAGAWGGLVLSVGVAP